MTVRSTRVQLITRVSAVTWERLLKARELRNKGLSIAKIAEKMNVCRARVQQILKQETYLRKTMLHSRVAWHCAAGIAGLDEEWIERQQWGMN